MLRIEYNFSVVDSLQVSAKSTRPPGTSDPEFGLRARSSGARTWRNMSLRHVSLREMGWSRNPTSSGCCPAKPESKGKATHGKFRKYAFLASQKTSFERGRLLRLARGPFGVASLRQPLQRQEMTWAIKKT